MHLFQLTNKKALITGASGGIGSAIAQVLHHQGATVALSGTRKEALEEVASGLERAHVLPCDLSNSEAVASLVDQAGEAMGGIDIVICNAGITKDNLVLRMKEEDFESVIRINLISTFILNKAAVKTMLRQKWGRIINIASVVAVMGNPGQANYAASKGGMIAMTKSIAQETASRGITVNCIAPGFISTKMTDILSEEQKDKLASSIPCGRFGQPEDIANAAVFLASNESSYVTGQVLHVNGGMVMV